MSEGEVPLSPGDVRWRTLLSRDESDVLPAHTHTAKDAFIELRDSFSASSVSDNSQTTHSSALKVSEILYSVKLLLTSEERGGGRGKEGGMKGEGERE